MGGVGALTYYMVSGGPITVICHSNTFVSSTRPAEKPSMGLRLSSFSCFRRSNTAWSLIAPLVYPVSFVRTTSQMKTRLGWQLATIAFASNSVEQHK